MDTIFALSSGILPSGVAIIRVSGDETVNIVKSLTSHRIPKPRFMQYSKFITPHGDFIDTGMVVYFKKPHSFTGEDLAEFHIHGSIATVSLFLKTLEMFKNCRMATAGEFSQRSFLNGKIDLIQAESLADLLEAETEAQRKLTITGTSKQLTALYTDWREKLLISMAYLTSVLDFSEDEDINLLDTDLIWKELNYLVKSIENHLFYAQSSEIIKNGLKIVLVGKPNAGKSSLLNKICNKDIAIVSDIPGTTRDILEGQLILNDIKVFFYDTAGIRKTSDAIEILGIDKTKKYIEEADIIFYIKDINDTSSDIYYSDKNIWKINTKCDVSRETSNNNYEFFISIYNDSSIENLLRAISKHLNKYLPKQGDILPVRHRHINLLKSTIYDIKIAIQKEELPIEIRAEYIRSAAHYMGKIIGKVDIENILDVVFSKFCIGK